MRKLYYIGLEPNNRDYSLQLTDWNTSVFHRRGLDYVVVPGESLPQVKTNVNGTVDDCHARSFYAMSQMMNLARMMKNGEVYFDDILYFEDMFMPGIECLPYIMYQVSGEYRPQIFFRVNNQSFDPDSYSHYTGMNEWMSHYEKMVDTFANGFIASSEEMVASMKSAGYKAPIYNVSGLPFSKEEVLNRVDNDIKPFNDRHMRVVFAGSWDSEKQPDFYMDFIEEWTKRFGNNVEFVLALCDDLKTNNMDLMERTFKLEDENKLVVYENLDRTSFYHLLNNTRVLFNCSLQDWTTTSVSEADTLGCNVLFPAYRSFPEVFSNDHTRLYIPWSIEDAITKMHNVLQYPSDNMGKISTYNDETIDRIVNIFEGRGTEYLRIKSNYRSHARHGKYF